MFINTETVVCASSVSIGKGVVEFELEEAIGDGEKEWMWHPNNEIIFVCRFCDSIIITTGIVKKYEKVPSDPSLTEQKVFSRLYVKGRTLSFSI